MAEKLRMECKNCGSTDVLADAYARWDYKKQQWVLAQTFDKGAYCNLCDGETKIKEVTVQ